MGHLTTSEQSKSVEEVSQKEKKRKELKKAQGELEHHVGMHRQVEESDMNDLVYLQAIIKETLRLYPAGPLLGPREVLEDCNVARYNVKAGTRLIVNVWMIQKDARVWPNPSSFQPERFLTTHVNVDFRGQNFELIPFGSGRRSCLVLGDKYFVKFS